MIRDVLRGRKSPDPKTSSLIIVYTLAKALAISPLEIYKMPHTMVLDLLSIHTNIEELKAEELEKMQKQAEARSNVR